MRETPDSIDTKNLLGEYYESFYINRLKNLDEMNKLPE